ncbi:MAG: hypothetical protein WAV13_11350, partial [Thermodesulfovibrionales bacterium]
IIHRDRSILQGIADKSLELMKARHSWEKFSTELRKVPFYVSDSEKVVLSKQPLSIPIEKNVTETR